MNYKVMGLTTLASLTLSGCSTTARDVGRGMQVGAASKFDNPIAPIWVSGIAIEKIGAKARPVRLNKREEDEVNYG